MLNKIRPVSFTVNYNGISKVLITEVEISLAFVPTKNEKPPSPKKYNAIWDTGATNSVITNRVAIECGLMPIDIVKAYTANGIRNSLVYLVGIWLPNNFVRANTRVTDGEITGADVLIGMDIINFGDFAVTNKDWKTTFSFRFPSIERIDFVKQIQSKSESIPKVGRNVPCPCGSGKKYKNCCGK